MDSFATWILRGLYEKQGKSRLSQISDLIDWVPIRHTLDEMYDNILMFKILILQQWFGLNDLEVERQMADRISFMSFLGFPDPIPDSRTVWLFKKRMEETGKDEMVWAELQRQLDAMGLQVRRGTIQDATFIEADHGSSKKPRGEGAKIRRSRDGTWAKKGKKSYFGYKLHQKTDIDYGLIREIETTTAKPLGELDKERNRLISILRSPGERPHAVIKRVFGAGRVLVTTVRRVQVKMMVTAFAFNLYQLCTLKNANVI
ncbi:MAG: transposase [Methanothrix sp.]|nr:transposase [Methanothrix sp.]